MHIFEKLRKIRAELPRTVSLIAVSKTHPPKAVMEAYHAGQRIFGENRPQELCAKHSELPKDIQWHMIGTLQTNKVKTIAPFVAAIHSVDSEKLLETVHKEALKNERVIDVLMEIRIAEEDSKHGWSEDGLRTYLSAGKFRDMNGIRIIGVMGMATFTRDREKIRDEFATLARIFGELKSEFFAGDPSFKEISMGMSDDYGIAVEQGSTMVRIGSSIFGAR